MDPDDPARPPVAARRIAPAREALLRQVGALLRADLRRREGGSRAEPPGPGRRSLANVFSTAGRAVFTAILGLLLAAMVVLGVGGVASLGEPVHWGTYTEERCDRARFGCRSFGSWVSDSGELRVDEVQLDGAVGPDGTVRAGYRPTGFNNDADNAIVHAEPWATLGPWMPWGFAALFGGVLVIQWSRWRRRSRRS